MCMYRQHMLIGGIVFAIRLESTYTLISVFKKSTISNHSVLLSGFEVEIYTNILHRPHYFR